MASSTGSLGPPLQHRDDLAEALSHELVEPGTDVRGRVRTGQRGGQREAVGGRDDREPAAVQQLAPILVVAADAQCEAHRVERLPPSPPPPTPQARRHRLAVTTGQLDQRGEEPFELQRLVRPAKHLPLHNQLRHTADRRWKHDRLRRPQHGNGQPLARDRRGRI
ncbi:hypothetical protein [Nonomuraea wenchangensis]|uniref:hypothetical protein n=1 Tax=Nonomuraea wenchangensis TaxID=568860 RepID=UPI0033271277